MENNNNRKKYYSRAYMLKYINTTSLAKINDKLSNNREGTDLQYAVSGYLFYNKKNRDLIKYNLLRRIRDEFELAHNGKDKKNPYKKVDNSINNLMNKRIDEIDLKKGLAKDINKWIENLNVSLLYIANENNIDYSSLYNFIKKDKLSDLSLENAHKVLFYLRRKDS